MLQVEKLPATIKTGLKKEDAQELEKKLMEGAPGCLAIHEMRRQIRTRGSQDCFRLMHSISVQLVPR
jgi:hypothetical protein